VTINTVGIRMGWEDVPEIRETVTITPMSEIEQDPTKGMAHIIAKDALSRVFKYLGVLAAGSVLMALLAAVQTFQEIQQEMDEREQQIQRLRDQTHHAEGVGTFTISPEGDTR
jgi:hypothetical protein